MLIFASFADEVRGSARTGPDCAPDAGGPAVSSGWQPGGSAVASGEQSGGSAVSGEQPGGAAVTGGEQPCAQLDESLITRIGQGDAAAFESLYVQTSNAVFAYAFSLLMNRENAEDVMQDTFLKVRAAAHLYRPMGKPMAWILTIARNLCMLRFRQMKRQAEFVPGQGADETGLSLIEEREDRMVLEAAMKVLSQEELSIIVLHSVSGMKHREISEAMQIPISTVLSRYQRGLRKLRKRLEEMNR